MCCGRRDCGWCGPYDEPVDVVAISEAERGAGSKPARWPALVTVLCCSDEAYMSVQCLEPKFYAQFLDILGLQDTDAFAEQYNPKRWPDQSRARDLCRKTPVTLDGIIWETDAAVAPFIPHGRRKMTHTYRIAASGKRWMACFARPPHAFDGAQPRIGDVANAMHIALKFSR